MGRRVKLTIDLERREVLLEDSNAKRRYPFATPEAFAAVSQAWLHCGWDMKHVYTFSWLGRPIIQLPEDLLRLQEAIYSVQPDVIVETGIAHGGGLVFYASLCKLLGRGRVVGVDIALRPGNRRALEQHELASHISIVDGSSVAPEVVQKVRALVEPGERVFVILDSNHTKQHVLEELEAYAGLVTPGSYVVATDGIMKELAGAPRSADDWDINNPYEAAQEFLSRHREFELAPPEWSFNESEGLREGVTYWPGAWLRRVS